MKTIFRIKWETILTIMMFFTTVRANQVYQDFGQDWKDLLVAMFCMIMTIVFIAGRNYIKKFRKELVKGW